MTMEYSDWGMDCIGFWGLNGGGGGLRPSKKAMAAFVSVVSLTMRWQSSYSRLSTAV